MAWPYQRHQTEFAIPDAELDSYLRFWQDLLGLNDWRIGVKKVREADGMPAEAGAYYWSNATHRVAEIWLRPEAEPVKLEDHAPGLIAVDQEHGLVHELLHLLVCVWDTTPDESAGNTLMEQMINAVAFALVHLKRQGAPLRSPRPDCPPAHRYLLA